MTHTIKVTHTIPSGETLDLASQGTVNIIPCEYTLIDIISTDPFSFVTGTVIDVTVLLTPTQTVSPMSFILVKPLNTQLKAQCDYGLSYTALAADGSDATSIVTINQSSNSLEVINDSSTITQQLTVTVKWSLTNSVGVHIAEATISVDMVNCRDPT